MIGTHPVNLDAPRIADVIDPAYRSSGVYAIWIGEQCAYVGQSSHVRTRLTTHRQKLRKGNHPSASLQALYDTRQDKPFMATLLPHKEGIRRQELAWLEELRPAGNTDTCSQDFHPKYRQIRAYHARSQK